MAKKKNNQKVINSGNLDYTRAVHELRSSGAAGIHGDRRLKRQKTRAAVKQAAVNSFYE